MHMEIRFTPQESWVNPSHANCCQNPDCVSDHGSLRMFGYFDKKHSCSLCGIVVCDDCVQLALCPPRITEPSTCCPQCASLAKAYLERRTQRAYYSASSSSSPPPAVSAASVPSASSPVLSPTPLRGSAAASPSPKQRTGSEQQQQQQQQPTLQNSEELRRTHPHSHDRDPTEDLALSNSSSIIASATGSATSSPTMVYDHASGAAFNPTAPVPFATASTNEEQPYLAIIASLQQHLREAKDGYDQALIRLVDKYEARLVAMRREFDDALSAAKLTGGATAKASHEADDIVTSTTSTTSSSSSNSNNNTSGNGRTLSAQQIALVERTEQRAAQLQAELDALKATHIAAQLTLQREISSRDSQIAALKTENEDLEGRLELALIARDGLEAEMTQAAQSIQHECEARISALRADNEQLASRNSELLSRCEALEQAAQRAEQSATTKQNKQQPRLNDSNHDHDLLPMLDAEKSLDAVSKAKKPLLEKLLIPLYFENWRLALCVRSAKVSPDERNGDEE